MGGRARRCLPTLQFSRLVPAGDGSTNQMTQAAATEDLEAITAKLANLQAALADGLSRQRCLRRWSEFIRARDGHRCVDCHSRRRLSAHHICRKSFLAEPQFETGNGITLCSACHREMHRGFNARPTFHCP